MPQNINANNAVDAISQTVVSLTEKGIDIGGKILFALLLLVIGWIIATIVSKGVKKLLNAINAEKLMDKIKEVDLFASINFSIVSLISKFLFWMIFIVFLMQAMNQLGMEQISSGIESAIGYLPRVITALFFFVIGTILANLVRTFIRTTTDSIGISAGRFIGEFVFYFLFIMITIISLEQAGIKTDILTKNIQIILAAALGGLALGFGLSSRDLFGNMLGGFYSKGKFDIGQEIEVDNLRGKISDIDNTSVTLDLGDKSVVIPLSQLSKSNVVIYQ